MQIYAADDISLTNRESSVPFQKRRSPITNNRLSECDFVFTFLYIYKKYPSVTGAHPVNLAKIITLSRIKSSERINSSKLEPPWKATARSVDASN